MESHFSLCSGTDKGSKKADISGRAQISRWIKYFVTIKRQNLKEELSGSCSNILLLTDLNPRELHFTSVIIALSQLHKLRYRKVLTVHITGIFCKEVDKSSYCELPAECRLMLSGPWIRCYCWAVELASHPSIHLPHCCWKKMSYSTALAPSFPFSKSSVLHPSLMMTAHVRHPKSSTL